MNKKEKYYIEKDKRSIVIIILVILFILTVVASFNVGRSSMIKELDYKLTFYCPEKITAFQERDGFIRMNQLIIGNEKYIGVAGGCKYYDYEYLGRYIIQ